MSDTLAVMVELVGRVQSKRLFGLEPSIAVKTLTMLHMETEPDVDLNSPEEDTHPVMQVGHWHCYDRVASRPSASPLGRPTYGRWAGLF